MNRYDYRRTISDYEIYEIVDRKGHANEVLAKCLRCDDAEQIVTALNALLDKAESRPS